MQYQFQMCRNINGESASGVGSDEALYNEFTWSLSYAAALSA